MFRILFAGSGTFAIRPFDALVDFCASDQRFELVGLISQPPKPAGRGRHLTDPPLVSHSSNDSRYAELIRFSPEKLSTEADQIVKETKPDLIIVVDYGQFIPESMLTQPKFQCLNIHPSLLPKYRGAIPIPAAILNGDKETGVTIQRMQKEMDAGPILAQVQTPIDTKDNAQTLADKLSEQAAALLVEVIPRWVSNELTPKEQDDALATVAYEADLTKAKARIDWSQPTTTIDQHIRGFFPDPIAWTTFKSRRLRILKAIPVAGRTNSSSVPGNIFVEKSQLFVATGDTLLEIITVQPEGKKAMTAAAFIQGYRPTADRLV